MVNRVNVRKVADAIEAGAIGDLGFNIAQPLRGRATDYSGRGMLESACILGWAQELFPAEYETSGGLDVFFGVDDDAVIGPLIMPKGYALHPHKFPAQAAVSCLRHLARTGKVDWARATKSA